MDVLARNNVTVTGRADGPTLVFAHGFGCDQQMWRLVAPCFEATCRVVLFDHVGAGGADPGAYDPVRHARLEGYAADVVEVVEAVAGNGAGNGAGSAAGAAAGTGAVRPVVFVGHSVSAMVGVLAAAQRPELFDRLVLVGPSPRYVDDDGYRGGFSQEEIDELLDTMDGNYLGWSQHIAPVIMGVPDRPELGQELTSSFCRSDPAIARRFARTTFLSDNRADLASVTTPALVLQSREDVIAPPEVGRYVADALPHGELVVLDSTGHCPNLSAPDQVVAAVRRWLDVDCRTPA